VVIERLLRNVLPDMAKLNDLNRTTKLGGAQIKVGRHQNKIPSYTCILFGKVRICAIRNVENHTRGVFKLLLGIDRTMGAACK